MVGVPDQVLLMDLDRPGEVLQELTDTINAGENRCGTTS